MADCKCIGVWLNGALKDYGLWFLCTVSFDIAHRNTSLWNWEDFVDNLTAVQRGLREMEAWLTMAQYWQCHYSDSASISLVTDCEHIGVWLNRASKDHGLWLLHIGVIPVYIIHLMVKDLDYPSQPKSNVADR